MHEYKLHAIQRKIRRLSENDGAIMQAMEMFCDRYCKYPQIYDEETEGIPLAESEYCRNCPFGGV